MMHKMAPCQFISLSHVHFWFDNDDKMETLYKEKSINNEIIILLWSEMLATLIGKCDPCRIHGFCTRVGLAILESHSLLLFSR